MRPCSHVRNVLCQPVLLHKGCGRESYHCHTHSKTRALNRWQPIGCRARHTNSILLTTSGLDESEVELCRSA